VGAPPHGFSFARRSVFDARSKSSERMIVFRSRQAGPRGAPQPDQPCSASIRSIASRRSGVSGCSGMYARGSCSRGRLGDGSRGPYCSCDREGSDAFKEGSSVVLLAGGSLNFVALWDQPHATLSVIERKSS
jgi:hypothetical protein